MPCLQGVVFGGIDTHKDRHMAALVDESGAVIATHAFSTTRAGYRALLRWMTGFGQLQRVGVEQTGSYGTGVVRHLALAGVPVLEVTGTNKAERRSRGKDDTLDAIIAARAALEGKRISVAKQRDGLCGVAPLPASSGMTQRHRLSRGGDRQANRALHLAAICRLRLCPRTRAYANRRKAEGLSSARSFAASSAPSPARSTTSSSPRLLDRHESVQGSQYTSFAFTRRLAAEGDRRQHGHRRPSSLAELKQARERSSTQRR